MTDPAKKKPGLRIVAVVAGGLAAVAVASSIAIRSAYEGVESRAFSTIDYIRQQSLTYESYNHATSMKSTMRALENATNLAREIAGDGVTDPQKLAEYARDLRVTGVIVLDADGRVASEYSTDGVGSAQLADELSRGALLDVAQNRSKVYGSAVTLPDGGRVDVDAACREDAPGIVVSLYHTSADFANRYTLNLAEPAVRVLHRGQRHRGHRTGRPRRRLQRRVGGRRLRLRGPRQPEEALRCA